MDKADQFESLFRRAERAVYRHEPLRPQRILLVEGWSGDAEVAFEDAAKAVVKASLGDDSEWSAVRGEEYASLDDLLERVEAEAPDLIVTHRHLKSPSWRWPHTLGEFLDVLLQKTPQPVLVLPHPQGDHALQASARLSRVMVLTDHLSGEGRLVNHGLGLMHEPGHLVLCHLEDAGVFERYLAAISRIPAIETAMAKEEIQAELLREPKRYIDSIVEGLSAAGEQAEITPVVALAAHRIVEMKRLMAEHAVDLLVIATKDEDQLAMHGLSYPLAVELRGLPLLMI